MKYAATAFAGLLLLPLCPRTVSAQEGADPQQAEGEASAEPRAEADEAATRAGSSEEQDALAAQYFGVAQSAFNSGEFERALGAFRESYALSQRPLLLYNIALCYHRLLQLEEALEYYRRYLVEMPDPPQASAVRAQIEIIEDSLASRGNDTSGEGGAQSDGPQVVAPGEGSTADSGSGADWVPWALVGVGGAALVASVITGVAALGEQSTLDGMCDAGGCDPGFEDAQDRGRALSIATDVLWVSGAVLAAAGLVWGLIQLGSGDDVQVAAGCTSDGCAALIRGEL